MIIHGIGPQSRPLKTGQTIQYGGYDDDGALERGRAKSYTVLTTGQYSGTVNITLNAKTDVHSNECVLDNGTGLMWSRNASASVGVASNGVLPWTTNGSGEGAFTFCAQANAVSLSGHTDWRVPNIFELHPLIIVEAAAGALDVTAFPNWATWLWLWSSTTAPQDVLRAQYLHIQYGIVGYDTKTNNNRVLLVRGGV